MTVIKAKKAYIENQRWISPATIEITDGVIVSISKNPLPHSENHIDLSEMILLPGFTNAHCHLEFTGIGPLPQGSFSNWITALSQAQQHKTVAAISTGIKKGISDLTRSGVTTVIDHLSSGTDLSAYDAAPLHIIGFGEILGAEHGRAKKSLEKILRRQAAFPVHATPHAVYSVHPKILKTVLKNKSGPFSIHIAESQEEKDYFEKKSGPLFEFIQKMTDTEHHNTKSAFDFLKQHLPAFENILLIHGNDFTQNQLDSIAKMKNVCIVHCPGSFAFFGHKNFPLAEILERKIPLALGTDSLCSNTDFNILHEIQLFLKKVPQIDFETLLPMLTTNALKAVGAKNTGALKQGFVADLIGFSAKDSENILDIFKTRKRADFVMCRGRQI